jgi:uncharacterized protein (DUF488 family)
MSTLYTLGYAARDALIRLDVLMRQAHVELVDIRFSPRSRFFPAVRQQALQDRFGERYHHLPALGNVNYRDRSLPIVLHDEGRGLSSLLVLLDRGSSVCLLCSCAHVETCHRRVVAELVRSWVRDVHHL